MSLAQKYIREGHPSIEELLAEQGLAFPRDPHELLGNFLSWRQRRERAATLVSIRLV